MLWHRAVAARAASAQANIAAIISHFLTNPVVIALSDLCQVSVGKHLFSFDSDPANIQQPACLPRHTRAASFTMVTIGIIARVL